MKGDRKNKLRTRKIGRYNENQGIDDRRILYRGHDKEGDTSNSKKIKEEKEREREKERKKKRQLNTDRISKSIHKL
jgi:hypothetical protein